MPFDNNYNFNFSWVIAPAKPKKIIKPEPPRVTLSQYGININKVARELLKGAEFVSLGWDSTKQCLAIKPTVEHAPGSLKLSPRGKAAKLSGLALFQQYPNVPHAKGIEAFYHDQLNMLIVDLSNVGNEEEGE